MTTTELKRICREWREANPGTLRAALVDMDGTLYDSMGGHADAWHAMMSAHGISCTRDEFFLYEGMTGRATIDHIFMRELGRKAGEDEAKELYAEKTAHFKTHGKREKIAGAGGVISRLLQAEVECVLVTGSAQASLLDKVAGDFPGAFQKKVTATDVKRGKPDPEPYLAGLRIAGVKAADAIVLENAPLGVESGRRAGIFTIAVLTGPIPEEEFVKAGANIIFPDMKTCASEILTIIGELK